MTSSSASVRALRAGLPSLLLAACNYVLALDNAPNVSSCLTESKDGSACYNCLSKKCQGEKSNDLGDATYKACIQAGTNACDKKFPANRPVQTGTSSSIKSPPGDKVKSVK